MKNNLLFSALGFVLAVNVAQAQTCVDSTLIDPTMMCPMVWDPVCGCNGVTYGNDCEAVYLGGVTSWVNGECTGTELDCVDLGGIDFGACDMAMGVVMWNGACTYLSGCGWEVNGVDYSAYSFQSIEECQANCPETAQCIDPSLADPMIDCDIFNPAPVCGCDSLTHFNECVATYVDYVSTFEPGTCPGDCFDETRLDPEMGCPEYEDPVCGCDSVTYSNPCFAWYYGGIAQWTPGPCENVGAPNLTVLSRVQLYPNPSSGWVQVSGLPVGESVDLKIWDLSGVLVHRVQFIGGMPLRLPSQLAKGVYAVELHTVSWGPVRRTFMVE